MWSVAWAIAASDLGIRVTAPYVEKGASGDAIEFVALVRDFGARRGTYVWYMPDPLPTTRLRHSVPYFVSALNPALYEEYDRDRFIELLNQWGWTGQGAPPDWYTSL